MRINLQHQVTIFVVALALAVAVADFFSLLADMDFNNITSGCGYVTRFITLNE